MGDRRKTTLLLTKDYEALDISESSVMLMPFEKLALVMESNATLQTVKALLDRFEKRYVHSEAATATSANNIDHLLKRLASLKPRVKEGGSSREGVQIPVKLTRYPVRVVLCAYMIFGQPDVVFNGQGEHETALVDSAKAFIREFELLIKIILDGPAQGSPSISPSRRTFRGQLECFDAAWCSYLYNFVVWKVKDARSLEEDLVRVACQLELSMMQRCRVSAQGDTGSLTHDMKAIREQVEEDHKLLREKVLYLSGDAGIQRMESALSDTRSRFFKDKERGSSAVSPISQPSSAESFTDDSKLVTENEILANEIIHEQRHVFAKRFEAGDQGEDNIKVRIKETMEKAFWDSIQESIKADNPDYTRVVELIKEVRDELSDMAPRSWKHNIVDTIDLDILSQVLTSGSCDMEYLGKILDFALVTLVKLSAPDSEEDMVKRHEKLMNELREISQAEQKSFSFIAMVKGLRFVLEQIQVLKREISITRIRMLEPVIQGPAGLEYLRNAFSNRYGDPVEALKSIPLTVHWLLSVRVNTEQEWREHTDTISMLTVSNSGSCHGLPPSTSLRTGHNVAKISNNQNSTTSSASAAKQPECKGERVDVLVSLGLLKLTSCMEEITQETLPETFQINFSRLRVVQAQIQKIIVIATSMLVLRQTLLCEKLGTCPIEMENIISKSYNKLTELLDRVDDVGTADIIETVSKFSIGDSTVEPEKLQVRKEIMINMLAKSLRSGDAVFEKVSRAVYLAARGVVFGGSGLQGKKLAETALRRVGAALLADRVREAAEVLIVVATLSCSVHGPWYTAITKNVNFS